MVWSEYVEHTTGDNEYEYSDDEYQEPPSRRLTVDEWTTWYSEDLLNMWFSLVQSRQDSGRFHDILKDGSYTAFCEFCYRFSHGFGV